MSKVHFGLGLVLGAFLGAGATYFLTRDDLDKELSEQNENIRKYYKEKYEKELKEATEKLANEVDHDEEDVFGKYDKVLLNFDYSSVADKPSENEEETETVETKPAEEQSPKKSTVPYPITQAEFDDENRDYYKEEYTYYPADETLVNMRGKPVDAEPIGGPETLRLLHKKENSEIYIRNDLKEMDFHISVDREDYL